MEENKVIPHSTYYDRKTGEAVTFVRSEFARCFRPAGYAASFTFDLKPESYRALDRLFRDAYAFPSYFVYGKIDTRAPNDDRADLEEAIDAFVDRDEGEAAALAVKIRECAETYAAHFPANANARTAKIDRLIAAVDVYDTQDNDQLSNARPVIEAIDALTRA